ncbi:hypothetical protein [Sphingobacterium mizutaii]|uniref:hypothetical protein n=1 Tax=Sphingobacterium mizutaii TaxID=1010 RepID=UPI003D973BFE
MKKYLLIILIIICLKSNSVGQSIDLTDYLPKNYVKNGSVDYTDYIQKGLNDHKNITFPNFPVLINQKGLRINSDQTLNFSNNSILIMKPNSLERYSLLLIENVSNVVINNPNLIGDRDRHLGNKGEWGMGISVLSSKNIVINNPKVCKFWGDGIYIGEIFFDDRKRVKLSEYFSKNVSIVGGQIDNNRRNGISVVSVKGLKITNTIISKSSGTLPMAGIDIEPNNNQQFLEDILIFGVKTTYNGEVGIKYVPSNFHGTRDKKVSVTIQDCMDIGSKIGLFLGGGKSKYSNIPKKMSGYIKIINFKSYSNKLPLQAGSVQKYNPNINMDSFQVFRNNKRDHQIENKLKNEARSKSIMLR